MHIAVLNLTAGSGGYRKYLRVMLPLMVQDPRVSRITVCSPAGVLPEPVAGVEHWTWNTRKRWGDHHELRRYLRELSPDVVLIPTARWVDAHGAPTAVMVRNMEPLTAPFGGNTLAVSLKNIARSRVARSSSKRADRILAVSQHVQNFLERRWNVDRASIGLVYHGVSEPAAPSETRAPDVGALSRPTLFTAGSIRPARGLEDLIQAIALLRADGVNARLLVAGGVDSDARHYKRKMLRLSEDLNVSDSIRWAGQLNESEMSWCFYNSDVFVMTSRAEACPNTALEAMAHGAVCVTGNNEPMPEFFGDSASYYDIGNAASLARTLRTVLSAPADERNAMRARARRRATDFTWSTTASRTIDELEAMVRSHRVLQAVS